MKFNSSLSVAFAILFSFISLLSCNNNSHEENDPVIDPVTRINELTSFKEPELAVNGNQALGEEGCQGIPTKISDFNSDWIVRYYRFTSDKSANANLFGFKGNISSKEVVIVKDYSLSKDAKCNGADVPYGIGLRLFVKVKSTKKGAEISTIAKVSASVELNKAEASYELSGYGFNIPPGAIDEVFSQSGESFTVEDFGKVTSAFNKIAILMKDGTPGLTINPKRLPNN